MNTNQPNYSAEGMQLLEAIQECLSPHTTALVAACVREAGREKYESDEGWEAKQGAQWFGELLADAIGGWDAQARLASEIGI